MEREKAEEPTTAWTWPETSPGDTIGSARSWVSGAQSTVQTFDALVKEELAKAATTERSLVATMVACRDTATREMWSVRYQFRKGMDRRQALQ